MKETIFMEMKNMRVGILLAVLTVLFGFSIGGSLGSFEEGIKSKLAANAEPVKSEIYKNDESAIKKAVSFGFRYIKRAHFHGGGIAAASIALILLLLFLPAKAVQKKIAAGLLGAGSLGYSAFWLFAGLKIPSTGSAEAAKEAFGWLAIPSAGFLLVGVVLVIYFTFSLLFIQKK